MVALLGSPRPRTNSAGDKVDQMCQLILGPFFLGRCNSNASLVRRFAAWVFSNSRQLPKHCWYTSLQTLHIPVPKVGL